MIRTLDLREQKSKNFIPDAFPGIKVKIMDVGDYESVILVPIAAIPITTDAIDVYTDEMGDLCFKKGNNLEIKIGPDFGIHTEPLERFRDELCRMRDWQKRNPHVDLHAVWVQLPTTSGWWHYIKQWNVFVNMCCSYNVWPHWERTDKELIKFLKLLDQPKSYQRDVPFIKRTKEPTDLARAIRVPKGVSSDIAIQLSECQSFNEIMAVKGMMKKDGNATKLWDKINNHLGILKDYWFTQWHGGQDHI
jgi:hypothetical protein